MAGVTLKGVSKSFGKTQVIENLDLDIQDQEFMVLVGPSGCGKSTALRMIAGLEDVTAGQVLIDGKVVNDLPPKERDIAMVFQSYALYPHMTVRENMAFGLKIRKLPAAEVEKLVGEAARVLDIQHLLDRRPRELSGGRSCASLRCSCSTSRSPTSTPSCACRRAPRSRVCSAISRPPPSTSPTTRSKP
jgi:ABC-type sugar transport system ATPase subunit